MAGLAVGGRVVVIVLMLHALALDSLDCYVIPIVAPAGTAAAPHIVAVAVTGSIVPLGQQEWHW